ncbi:hypothetical protein PHMEG_00010318 [Phytophthora megakarya]|uniref:Uncharacterized protein n=1 Tax=Phytophthora megakarya TaxID=4795 RepID=A0A225WDZ6_9STRA|nr:hypothetical protein PHMEG_00010318 [Phytophthora megakarya]
MVSSEYDAGSLATAMRTTTKDLCVALWERQVGLQVLALDNAIRKFKEDSDPLDLFTHVILNLWHHLNRMQNNGANLLHQPIDRLAIKISREKQPRLPDSEIETDQTTEIPLQAKISSHLSEIQRATTPPPWTNRWIDAPAEHQYNTTYAPYNPGAPLFVPTSITRQAVISGIVVDQSLADADIFRFGSGSAPKNRKIEMNEAVCKRGEVAGRTASPTAGML